MYVPDPVPLRMKYRFYVESVIILETIDFPFDLMYNGRK